MREERKKSYLLANASFYPSAGGVETTLRGMVEGLVEDGHSVTVVAGSRTNTASKQKGEYEQLFGADVFRYKTLPFFLYYFTAIFLLRRVKKNTSVDTIISRSFTTTICLWFAGFRNIKYIAPASYSLQNHPKFTSGNKAKRYVSYFINSRLERFSLLFLDEVIVFSSEMKGQVKQISRNKRIKMIFPGVDKKRFKPVSQEEKNVLRKKYSVPIDKKVLLFIGRAEKVKNSLDSIRILKYLPNNFITVYVGEGSDKQAAIELSKKNGLQERVKFFDFSSKPEEFFQLSDAFLMTSVYEPFGQVILEALSCGIKVFGYSSSDSVRTATTEIFEELKVNIPNYLADFSVEELAIKVRKSICSQEDLSLNVYGWNEFVYRVEK